jgi:hypothetical protein
MATLADITKKSRSLADTISKRVATYAPEKTGNLKRALKRANTIDSMFEMQGGNSKDIGVKSMVFTYNYAPDDAPYGMWWNDPTLSSKVKNGQTKNIPESINFVEKGLNDSKVVKAIDELVDLIGQSVLFKIDEELKLMESDY